MDDDPSIGKMERHLYDRVGLSHGPVGELPGLAPLLLSFSALAYVFALLYERRRCSCYNWHIVAFMMRVSC